MPIATRPIPELTAEKAAKFHASYKRVGECWIWQGARNVLGYGTLTINCRSFVAHRVAYAIHNGRDPGDLLVCHTCDNPPCVNPAHLWLGTAADNIEDMMSKGRHPSGVLGQSERCRFCGGLRSRRQYGKRASWRCNTCNPRELRQSLPPRGKCPRCGHIRTDDFVLRDGYARCSNCRRIRERARNQARKATHSPIA